MKLYKCDACGEVIEAEHRQHGLYAYDLCWTCKVKENRLDPRTVWIDAIRRAPDPPNSAAYMPPEVKE